MIIAHLPAGFLLTRHLLRGHRQQTYFLSFMLAGMFASIAPDLDMFYHHLIDNRQHGHHSYWSHIPFFWMIGYLLLMLPAIAWKGRKALLLLSVVLAGGLCHTLLDSITSGIKWLYPVDTHYFGLWRKIDISNRYSWWVWNYVFHWSFLLEIIIWLAALVTLFADRVFMRSVLSAIRRRTDY